MHGSSWLSIRFLPRQYELQHLYAQLARHGKTEWEKSENAYDELYD
jgi:hypothetical protein